MIIPQTTELINVTAMLHHQNLEKSYFPVCVAPTQALGDSRLSSHQASK